MKKKESAQDAFIKNYSEIQDLMKKLNEANDEHFYTNPDNINWGDVGSLAEIKSKLKRLLEFIN